MRSFIFLLFIGILISFTSCRKDFDTVASSGNLEFSASKVYLDTVFTNIGSSTYSLKVYNRSNKDISIPSIQLGKGLASKYRLMVDGMTGNQGKIFNNVELLAKDSLFIFIETTVDIASANPTDFTYNDQILFDNGSNQQSVDLVTLIQDAKFIFPNRTLNPTLYETLSIAGSPSDIIGHTLTDNDFSPVGSWQFNNLKPYVIYGYAEVPAGKTLTINDGASLYFHSDTYSGLIVDKGAKLIIDGHVNITNPTTGAIITKHEVTFEADRLEPEFEDTPGQWGGVYIISELNNSGVNSNVINYLKLKNATFGIYTQNGNSFGSTPNLEIKNSQIYGCSFYGLLSRNTNVIGQNVVINSAGKACVSSVEGGNYDFTHCTFNNNWSSSKQVAVQLDDYVANENNVVTNTFNLNSSFKNCIIYGSNNIELFLDKKGTNFTSTFDHCLIKFNDANTSLVGLPLYNFINGVTNTFGNIKNVDPKFKNVNKNQLNILFGSGAIGNANFSFSGFKDILDFTRTSPSDIGAYNKP
jgi:hypothetical protein